MRLKTAPSPRGLRCGALFLLFLLPALPAHARAHRSEAWARERFAYAERMREALNGRPPGDRTRHDYQRVLNAYRNVYYGAPLSTKADPSVVAVAETLVEMGRHFEDDKILNEAVAQYKFLRREYPGSKYRFDALFTIGEIYKEDLNDAEQARSAFQEFLKRYPQHRLAEDAQRAILDLEREAEAKKTPDKADKRKSAKKESENDGESTGEDESQAEAAETSPEGLAGKLARVTRIRHWSTPDSTRVAIDLEGDVKFAAQRISHPDRIYFDLRGTKLASTLLGKSFDVDDGFLKKIRVAQFQPGRTRVVLEVEDLSDYEAFLIPNPYRLIIDVHGKNARARLPKAPSTSSAKGDDEEASAKPAADREQGAAEQYRKSQLRAEAGKAPITSMDVAEARIPLKGGDVAGASSDRPGKAVSSSRPATPIVKKVVDPDDEDDDDSSTAAKKSKSSDDDSQGPKTPPMKVSATRHTVVSRSRRKASAQDEEGNRAGDFDVREAQPNAAGDRSLIRALGLKIGRIVIDPGHGGHDTGTIGPGGLEEKDLVLEVGKRLGKLLETRLGAGVVYTRKDDTFIPLETRTAIANQERADLFISIHANSSRDPDARGVETYYLNFTSSPEALEVAARENAVSEKSIYELQDLVKKIALKEKIEESREFASNVQQSLHNSLASKSPGIRDRGVKKAPFIVLIGANMPSILAEISFVSNPGDERRLETADYRQRIAESLYRGVAKYVNGLSGVKVASKIDKAATRQ
jgi:N-acetylmuramoyl-L-alanine amidase